MKNVRFGVLSTAKIAAKYVIPAMQQGDHCEIAAIASRNAGKAEQTARELGIPGYYGSYEELLDDPDIDAIYNPLPNHLHVPWTIKALEAGKHVLCEKPVALNADEAQTLLETSRRYPDLKVMEAFMYRFQPRWQRARQLVRDGAIGELKIIHSFFSYYNDDPENIRNKPGMGGGGLMDIGCYSVNSARFLFGSEPVRATGALEIEPGFEVDRLASGLLEFSSSQSYDNNGGQSGGQSSAQNSGHSGSQNGGHCVFSCTMRSPGYQYIKIFGTWGHLMMDWPFNPSFDKPSRMTLTTEDGTEELTFEPCNHFTLQGDRFAECILENRDVPTPLEDAVSNMKVLDELQS